MRRSRVFGPGGQFATCLLTLRRWFLRRLGFGIGCRSCGSSWVCCGKNLSGRSKILWGGGCVDFAGVAMGKRRRLGGNPGRNTM